MDHLVFLHIALLLLLGSMAGIFALIYWQNRQEYLRYWLNFQVWNFVAAILLFIYLFNLPDDLFNGLFQICFLIAAYALLNGTYLLINRSPFRFIGPLFGVTSIGVVLAIIYNWPPVVANLPGPILVCSCFIATGCLLLKQKQISGLGRLVTGAAFILWGIHILGRPFLIQIPVFVPYGYAIMMGLSVSANLGQVLIYFDISHDAVNRREKQFRLLVENARDTLFRYRLGETPGFEYISPSSNLLYGYSPAEHYKDPELWCKILDEQYHEIVRNYRSNPQEIPSSLELRVRARWGELIWLEQTSVVIKDNNRQVVAIEGIIRDISQRRAMEEKLRRLSLYDALTGVYNRAFLEMKLAEVNASAADCGGIIVGDIDGLKLINDALGHIMGDQLLRTAAGILTARVGDNEMIARMGGDEFVILLPEAQEERVVGLVADIYREVSHHNQQNEHMPISISLGYAVRRDRGVSFTELLRQADNNMYREKLQRSRLIRSTLVKTLASMLAKRDSITEEHAKRMEDLICRLGECVGLTEASWPNLRLFARFHDLGNVGVPDRILFKTGPLTANEREEIERHCEIGYRIAQSGPELSVIADWILKHHEWWNGQGYPLGLAGEDIPVECRLMALVDAFHAMTSERPYRGAMSVGAAVDEICKGAGSQFDPQIVPKFIKLITSRSNSDDDKLAMD